MKTSLFTSVLITLLFTGVTLGQDVTTVTATNYDISDNLDLTAVASIFGESKDLADFEYRLNNPKTQISNLDLDRDGRVDYLRVIEVVEENTHLIVLQSLLGKDLYQDVATIEVEKDLRNNAVRVQVVGDVFLYGHNYIYEPVYYVRPLIFNTFWHRGYVAYYSPWHWGYYPTYFSYWAPCPIFRYRTNVYTYVNVYNTYNYVTERNSTRAVAMHNRTRSNYYERQNPNRSFVKRNEGFTNSYVRNQTRSTAVTGNTRNSTRNNTIGVENSSSRGSSVETLSNSSRSSSTFNSSTSATRNNAVGTTSTLKRNSSTFSSSNITRGNAIKTTSPQTRSSSLGTVKNSTRSTITLGSNKNSTRSSIGSKSSGSRNSAPINTLSGRNSSSNRISR